MQIHDNIIKAEKVDWKKVEFLQNDNLKEITQTDFERLKTSLREKGFIQPLFLWQTGSKIYGLDGKHRRMALESLEGEGVLVPQTLTGLFVRCKNKKDAAEKVLIYSSVYAHIGDEGLYKFAYQNALDFDEYKLMISIPEFDMDRFEMGYVRDDSGNGEGGAKEGGGANLSLAERFIIPPFSVLDARQGYWQDRKRKWIELGIQSELGRGENLQGMSESNGEYMYNKKNYTEGKEKDSNLLGFSQAARSKYKKTARTFGQDLMKGEHTVGKGLATGLVKHRALEKQGLESDFEGQELTGTSIFDPVLSELMYRWFAPLGGKVLDPFAGGSVRGIVAAYLGYKYTGVDLSERQIIANRAQAEKLELTPVWIPGDSINIKQLAPGEYDFIFSCPPYYNLEVYSDTKGDISNLPSYADFLKQYTEIIHESVSLLSENRFACFVVGDIRAKSGYYNNFISDTIAAFQSAGMKLYNEAILVTVVGSLPIRVVRQFTSARKLGKTHQNVLVFYKGKPKEIRNIYTDIQIEDFESGAADEGTNADN